MMNHTNLLNACDTYPNKAPAATHETPGHETRPSPPDAMRGEVSALFGTVRKSDAANSRESPK